MAERLRSYGISPVLLTDHDTMEGVEELRRSGDTETIGGEEILTQEGELIGLFLPLAAWTSASRRGAWHELLAATFVTVAIAIPLVVGAAFIEVYVSPHLILALRSAAAG